MPVARNRPVMELYLSNSVEDLNRQAELPDKFKLAKPRLLIVTAQKLFNQALDKLNKGDSEASYVMYLKYLNVISVIRKTPDYSKDSKYYDNLIGSKNALEAINKAEELQKELIRRYSDRAEEALVKEKLAQLDLQEEEEKKIKEKQAKEATLKENKEKEREKTPPLPDDEISSWNLDGIIKQKSTSFIIFDVRSSEDFNNSHIKHPNCFSVPEETLKPGISADALYKMLPLQTRAEWPKRLTVDVIIIVDWFGTKLPGTAAFSLEEIFVKWDPNSLYKGTIKLLKGGYDEWLSRFPLQTTNPHATVATKPFASSLFSTDSIFDIEYPDLDAEVQKKPIVIDTVPGTPQPTVNRTTKPLTDTVRWSVEQQEPSPLPSPAVIVEPVSSRFAPQIDRNLKKEAVMKYLQDEERLIERSLETARERLLQEQEWDRIRMEKEASVNSELTSQLQLREEQLIEILKRMENDKKQQEAEMARLRHELEKYEKREAASNSPNESAIPDVEEKIIQERIQEKEDKKTSMYKEVERLRQLRKKQQTERAHQEAEEARKVKEQEELEMKRAAEVLRVKEEEARVKKLKAEEEAKRLRMIKPEPKKDNVNLEKLKDDRSASSGSFGFGSKMNRSHSTPDLAQALQNELSETPSINNKMPKVERALKPLTPNRTQLFPRHDLSNKNRNFNPVYGSMGRGLTGLKNLGNTCYMNSIIQCISNCSLLTNFFVDGSYRNYLNPNNLTTRGEITDEMSSTLKALWSGQYRSISCKDLKNAVGRYKSTFRGYDQQDSHEFFTILIDWLHEELNEIRKKAPLKEQNNYNIPDEKAAAMAWADYSSSNKSIIVKLFGGQQRSSLKCFACHKESVTFEPFFNLSLPIPQSRTSCSIMECFQLYTKPEHISGWSCPFCKNKKGASKTIDIWKLPPILVVHLQRFYNDGLWRKRLTMVDFNVQELDLDGVVKSNQPEYSRFKLYAVSNHYGTMDAGHYTAYCKNPEYNKWFKFDDQEVMEINGQEVRSAAAYILFYTAIDYQAPPVIQS